MAPPSYHSLQHEDDSSTAYHGAQGRILHDQRQDSFNLEQNDYGSIYLPQEPSKAITSARPALGARLLSTWSSAQPAAAALSRKGSVLHSRAKSLAGFMPKLSTTTSSPSVAHVERAEDSAAVHGKHPVFGNLFSGESAPIRLGAPQSPTKEEDEIEFVMDYRPTLTERPSGPRRRGTAQTSTTASPLQKQGWFGRKPTTPTSSPRHNIRSEPADDLLALNIDAALFPSGPADPLSPHAFNDLLPNASGLLQRMQTAYREKVEYIASIQPEIDAQKEEVEEAETRAKHLKMQLEDLSEKAEMQEQTLREIAGQLAEEKMRRVQLQEEAAGRTVRLVRRSSRREVGQEEEPTRRRSKRSSGGSASDSGFESDLEYADSVTSGRETPLEPPTMRLTPAYDGGDWEPVSTRPAMSSRESTRSGSSHTLFDARRMNSGGDGAAWAEVDALRGENRTLKRRVQEMEGAVQGCLDLVGASVRI